MNKTTEELFLIRVQKYIPKLKNSNKNLTSVSRASGEAALQKKHLNIILKKTILRRFLKDNTAAVTVFVAYETTLGSCSFYRSILFV